MTEAETLVLGGAVIGGMFAIYLTFSIIIGILLIIAMWKIFTKAGEAGWKSIIPIYNVYVFCKIIGVSFWKWVILCPLLIGVVSFIIETAAGIAQFSNIIGGIYSIILYIVMAVKLSKAFGKSAGFTVGLIIFPNIFQLILGFGSSTYVGTDK